jgi:uncharacterized protein YceK
MNLKRLSLPALGLSLLTLTSCGAVGTLRGHDLALGEETSLPRMFSGTMADVGIVMGRYSDDLTVERPVTSRALRFLDVPLSFLLDSLVLPYTAYTQVRYGSYDSSSESGQE